jgi:tetratricopeptide (TPR) repeat protein
MKMLSTDGGKRRFVIAALLLACTGLSRAAAPAQPSVPFAAAPPELRAFFIAAMAADTIADPLSRCLAFPDLPNNRWPDGLAVAHCHLAFDPSISLDMVKGYLERNDYDGLDALFQADLAKHFSKENFRETIHRDFDGFDGSPESNRVSRLWLDKAPKSAFALAARGTHLGNEAWKERGGKWASETPAANMERMSLLASLAIDLLEQSVEREPKLIHSYVRLINVGMLDSRGDVLQRAFDRGQALDPGCRHLTLAKMISLEPRWAGSYPGYRGMAAYAARIAPQLGTRPLVANTLSVIQVDQSSALFTKEQYKEKIALLRPVTIDSSYFDVYKTLAMSMAYSGDPDRLGELMYLLELYRFDEKDEKATPELGRILSLVGELDWAETVLEKAIKVHPDQGYAQVLFAGVAFDTAHYAKAEAAYVAALRDPETRRDALDGLIWVSQRLGRKVEARRYAELLTAEFPDFGRGWRLLANTLPGSDRKATIAALEKFVKTADRSDPGEAAELEHVVRWLAANKAK